MTEPRLRQSQDASVELELSTAPQLAEGAEQSLKALGFRLDEAPVHVPVEAATVTHRPRWVVPAILLIATLISMAWAGIAAWSPISLISRIVETGSLFEFRRHVLANWGPGILFSVSLAIILGAHELGHYFATRYYGIQSSLPIFIPFPITPTGTCGAVIMMDGNQADRKQIFDIGIAGPLAGLIFAIPIAAFGLLYGTPPETSGNYIQFGQPLVIQALAQCLASVDATVDTANLGSAILRSTAIANDAMNPMLMAAWVGFLVTGLNMVPISQLDGGHVVFGLLGRRSRIVSWIAYLGSIGYVIYTSVRFGQPEFILMLLLIPLMGISHPPSRNDNVSLGLGRQILGYLSLLIPFLCIPLRPVVLM